MAEYYDIPREFECPECKHINRRLSINTTVLCSNCGHNWDTPDYIQ